MWRWRRSRGNEGQRCVWKQKSVRRFVPRPLHGLAAARVCVSCVCVECVLWRRVCDSPVCILTFCGKTQALARGIEPCSLMYNMRGVYRAET